MFTPADLEQAQRAVYASMPPTPQYAWPLLAAEMGCETWVKHENHTPTGAFKLRGGLVHLHLRRQRGETNGVISATRGNHGQSLAVAGRINGIPVTIVAPMGNSTEKNAAMRAQGADLIEAGADFDEAVGIAKNLAAERGYDMIPSFHRELVLGVSTYAHELFHAAGSLDTVYVPIGLGSGICGVIAARDMLGLETEVVGVVSTEAQCYALSFAAGHPIPTNTARTFADGVAVRVPNPEALAIIRAGAARIVSVSDAEIAEAMRVYYRCTHNLAEGAGAAPLAALIQERGKMAGRRAGVILAGGNIDMGKFRTVLEGGTPRP